MNNQTHTAQCMCGNIKLEATGPANYVEYCHCKTCQQSAGSSYIIWVIFDKENVKITSGDLSLYQSSEALKRGFCNNCGATMTVHSARHFDIALGVMDKPDEFDITQHIWTKRVLKCIKLNDDLPKYEESAPN
ncbi:MAG: GFA family protein [Emcibacteraceae bacterium]|nr:GFA family protein [Emcibacteraceae bacterium]